MKKIGTERFGPFTKAATKVMTHGFQTGMHQNPLLHTFQSGNHGTNLTYLLYTAGTALAFKRRLE